MSDTLPSRASSLTQEDLTVVLVQDTTDTDLHVECLEDVHKNLEKIVEIYLGSENSEQHSALKNLLLKLMLVSKDLPDFFKKIADHWDFCQDILSDFNSDDMVGRCAEMFAKYQKSIEALNLDHGSWLTPLPVGQFSSQHMEETSTEDLGALEGVLEGLEKFHEHYVSKYVARDVPQDSKLWNPANYAVHIALFDQSLALIQGKCLESAAWERMCTKKIRWRYFALIIVKAVAEALILRSLQTLCLTFLNGICTNLIQIYRAIVMRYLVGESLSDAYGKWRTFLPLLVLGLGIFLNTLVMSLAIFPLLSLRCETVGLACYRGYEEFSELPRAELIMDVVFALLAICCAIAAVYTTCGKQPDQRAIRYGLVAGLMTLHGTLINVAAVAGIVAGNTNAIVSAVFAILVINLTNGLSQAGRSSPEAMGGLDRRLHGCVQVFQLIAAVIAASFACKPALKRGWEEMVMFLFGGAILAPATVWQTRATNAPTGVLDAGDPFEHREATNPPIGVPALPAISAGGAGSSKSGGRRATWDSATTIRQAGLDAAATGTGKGSRHSVS